MMIAPVHISTPMLPAIQWPTGAAADAISKVESFQNNATVLVDKFLSGQGEELHRVALATQQADLSMQLFMQGRNQVVSAYTQVMQMQV